jgi:hypothetical protein
LDQGTERVKQAGRRHLVSSSWSPVWQELTCKTYLGRALEIRRDLARAEWWN